MDLPSLTMLVEILDAGSLSEAARRLKVSRANVSYHLRQLEREVGAQLVRRTTRRLAPTEVGVQLYEHGRRIQEELLAAREAVSTLGGSLRGRVRLSVPSGYGQMVMSDWLIEFKRRYPDIVLDVLFENRVDDLLRDEVDIAIRVMSEPPPSLVARPLAPQRHVACASADYAAHHGLPTQLAELASVPVLTSGVVGRPLRLAAYRGELREEVLLSPTLVSEHFPFLHKGILAGLGIGIVPDYVVQADIAAGRVVTALDDWRLSIFGNQLFMLYMPNRFHTRATAALIEFVLAQARSNTPS